MYDFSYNRLLAELNRRVLDPIVQWTEEIWASQRKVHCCRTPELAAQIASGEVILEFTVPRKFWRKLQPKEKFFTYIFARLLEVKYEGELPTWLVQEWHDKILEYASKDLQGSEIYEFVSLTSRQEFIVWFLEYIYCSSNRVMLTSIVFNSRKRHWCKGVELTFLGFLLEKLQVQQLLRRPPEACRTQFRKGHRDHGSMGSEVSRTIRQQSQTGEWEELVALEEKKRLDHFLFLSGAFGIQ